MSGRGGGVVRGGESFLVSLSRFQDSIFYRHHHMFVFWKDGWIDGHMYGKSHQIPGVKD